MMLTSNAKYALQCRIEIRRSDALDTQPGNDEAQALPIHGNAFLRNSTVPGWKDQPEHRWRHVSVSASLVAELLPGQ